MLDTNKTLACHVYKSMVTWLKNYTKKPNGKVIKATTTQNLFLKQPFTECPVSNLKFLLTSTTFWFLL